MSEASKTVKTKRPFLYSVEFCVGLSVLVSLFSLALPWWGIDINLPSYSWGVLSGPSQPNRVDFRTDGLAQLFSQNYGFLQALVFVTIALTLLGFLLKRWPVLTAALISSLVTDLSFMDDVGNAVSHECDGVGGVSCISGLVGQGTSGFPTLGFDYVTWGFKPGFYVFVASGVLLLGGLALLQWNKSRGRIHPPPANLAVPDEGLVIPPRLA